MERPLNTAVVRINSDLSCHIYRFGKEVGRAGAHFVICHKVTKTF